LRRIDVPFVKFMMKSRFVSIVNLLADEELFPEFLTTRCPAESMAAELLRWLDGPKELAARRAKLEELRDRVARPGACAAAARFITATVGRRGSSLRDLSAAATVSSGSPS